MDNKWLILILIAVVIIVLAVGFVLVRKRQRSGDVIASGPVSRGNEGSGR